MSSKNFSVFLMCIYFIPVSIFSSCLSPPILSNEPIYYFEHYLGRYSVNLQSTLIAIKKGKASSGYPFYKKSWRGKCPVGLKGYLGDCIEYTVYPSSKNFMPGNIMKKIKRYINDGARSRGEVRVITNHFKTQYVYTLDHEKTFCGPYAFYDF